VWKTEDDLIDTYQPGRPPSAFTVPFDFVDIGPDGRANTGDERTIRMFGIPNSQVANFPNDSVVMNVPRYGRFKTIETSWSKRHGDRWSASIGGAYTWTENFPTDLYPNNPNMPGVQNRTGWGVKASGSYDAGYGIRLTPVLRHQSGVNFARTVTVSAPAALGLTVTSGTGDRALHYLEPADSNREDNIWVFDVRAEKTLDLGGNVKIRGFFDLFNIGNSHASETISRATGLSYLKPSAILAPRTARVGFRFVW
jgi:hypothetical protein